jgi:hypothetical protein
MKRLLLSIVALSLLLGLLDRVFRVLHPEVNLLRACLVGASAFALLAPLFLWRQPPLAPLAGALAIFASAFGSVLLIESGLLVSQSALSGLVHVAILAGVFAAMNGHRPRRSEARPGGL